MTENPGPASDAPGVPAPAVDRAAARTPRAPRPRGSEPLAIRDDSIRLGQALKLASLVEDGVEAKEVIAQGYVTVNGEVETRRGRQLRRKDWFAIGDQAVYIV